MKKRKQSEWFVEHFTPELLNSPLFKFVITLPNGQKIEVDLTADTKVDYDTIEEDIVDIPAQQTFYGIIYSELRLFGVQIERRIKARRGKLTELVLESGKADKIKFTDQQVKYVIESDETLNRLEGELALVQRDTGKMYHMVETTKMRLEVMRSLAGFKRQDRDAQK